MLFFNKNLILNFTFNQNFNYFNYLILSNFKYLNLKSIPITMGVLNITPDSFSDGGKFYKDDQAKKQN